MFEYQPRRAPVKEAPFRQKVESALEEVYSAPRHLTPEGIAEQELRVRSALRVLQAAYREDDLSDSEAADLLVHSTNLQNLLAHLQTTREVVLGASHQPVKAPYKTRVAGVEDFTPRPSVDWEKFTDVEAPLLVSSCRDSLHDKTETLTRASYFLLDKAPGATHLETSHFLARVEKLRKGSVEALKRLDSKKASAGLDPNSVSDQLLFDY